MAIEFFKGVDNSLTMNPLYTGPYRTMEADEGITGLQMPTVTDARTPATDGSRATCSAVADATLQRPYSVYFNNNTLPVPKDLPEDPADAATNHFYYGNWRVVSCARAVPYDVSEGKIITDPPYPDVYYCFIMRRSWKRTRISGQDYMQENIYTGVTISHWAYLAPGGEINPDVGFPPYRITDVASVQTYQFPDMPLYTSVISTGTYRLAPIAAFMGIGDLIYPDPVHNPEFAIGQGMYCWATVGTDNLAPQYFTFSKSGNYLSFTPDKGNAIALTGITFDPTRIDIHNSLILETLLEALGIDDPYLRGVDQYRVILVETSREVGDPSGPGGYDPDGLGHLDDSSDSIDLPLTPEIGISNLGMNHVYRCEEDDLQGLGALIFPDLTWDDPDPIDPDADIVEATIQGFTGIMTTLANIPSAINLAMMARLIDYVVDCHVLPVDPGANGSEYLKIGFKTFSELTLDKVASDYCDFDCGSIRIGEYYANFADYLGNAKLYLPFVGFVPVQPEWFTRSSINVTYRFDVIDGSFICFVRGTGENVNNNNATYTILAQYGGCACVHLPITGANYSRMLSGIISGAAGAVGGAMGGNIAAGATSALGALSARGEIMQSNGYNASTSFLGCRRPFLLIERVLGSWSQNYAHELGIPSNITTTIGSVSGFVRSDDIHLDGIPATEAEKSMIAQALKEGVIV